MVEYTAGNYYAFVKNRKPKDVDKKSAYIVGSGLAGLAAAAFLIRDGYIDGSKITIFEELDVAGGSLDGAKATGGLTDSKGNPAFVARGGREMEDHFETLWDLFRTIPSLEVKDSSVLDEFYWLNVDNPNKNNARIVANGKVVDDIGLFTLTAKSQEELQDMIMSREEDLYGKSIEDYFSKEFFDSNFWIYWASMFAFLPWHSAVEMRRYLVRFIHHIKGLPDLSALKFTRYNQYESLVKPLITWLKKQGVKFQYSTTVENVKVEITGNQKVAKSIETIVKGSSKSIKLTENDLVFVTNGSITESTTQGDNDKPAPITKELGGSWTLWENLARQSRAFGNPKAFYDNLPAKSWFVSATMAINGTGLDSYLEKLTKRNIREYRKSGDTITAGIMTFKDSNWMLSMAIHRQPHFKEQNPDQVVAWIYAYYSDTPGNYIKKPVEECTGEEIAMETLYHLGVPEDQIEKLVKETYTVPSYMPFISTYFMMRSATDRPAVIPDGSVNLAFIGNYAESATKDTVFTTEYSVRTAMEAVYDLLGVERTVPEVYGSVYDLRVLASSLYYLSDKKKLTDMEMPFIKKRAVNFGLRQAKNTFIGDILRDANLTD